MIVADLTYQTIRFATLCYFLAVACYLLHLDRWARVLWTVGCISYLTHVGCAFEGFYKWSHQVAYAETARQTSERFGVAVGSGIYWNYLFTAVWVVDAAWWWRGLATYRERPAMVRRAVAGFMAFLFFNGVVVFPTGAIRYWGAVGTVLLLLLWRKRKHASSK